MISLSDGDAVVEIEPERGGLVTRFDVGARRVLFMDETTLRDPTKNVRGGVPVLFPTPGKLAGDTWSYAGHTGTLKQHGFARNLSWRVVEAGRTTATIALESTDATRAAFPWDFNVEMTFVVRGSSLRLDHRVLNTGAAAMPFGFGFHPYFFVPDADKPRVRIATAATRAFDNATKQTVAVTQPIDLTRDEVDLHLLDHSSATLRVAARPGEAGAFDLHATESTLATPTGDVRLRGSAEYTHWVVWTLAGRDFVCLEPWTCPGDALNTGERLIVLAPSESRALSLEIAV